MARLVALACAVALLAADPPGGAAAQQNVLSELTRAIHPHVGIFDDVAVEIDNDTAILTGQVISSDKKAQIGARARQVAGVLSVRNELAVLPSSPEDDDLRYRIARSVYGHPAFWSHAAKPNPPIHIIVESGQVTLTGVVDSASERALARSLASGLGERAVTNRLKVRAAR